MTKSQNWKITPSHKENVSPRTTTKSYTYGWLISNEAYNYKLQEERRKDTWNMKDKAKWPIFAQEDGTKTAAPPNGTLFASLAAHISSIAITAF